MLNILKNTKEKEKEKKNKSKKYAPLLVNSLHSYKEQILFYFKDVFVSYSEKLYSDCKKENVSPFETFRCYQKKLQSLKSLQSKVFYTEIQTYLPPGLPLEEVLKLIFVSECMLLGSIQNLENKEINIEIPSVEDFVFAWYLKIAESIYGLPTVIVVMPGDKEKHVIWKREQLKLFIINALADTIRKFLPICDIVKNMGNNFQSVSSPKASSKKKLRKVILKEDEVQEKHEEEEEEEEEEEIAESN
jgi:hypothetical protein